MSHFDNILNFLKGKKHSQSSTGAIFHSCLGKKERTFQTSHLPQPTLYIGSTVTLRYDCPEFPCPKMTVKQLTPESAICLWFTDPTRIEVAEFPRELLKVC